MYDFNLAFRHQSKRCAQHLCWILTEAEGPRTERWSETQRIGPVPVLFTSVVMVREKRIFTFYMVGETEQVRQQHGGFCFAILNSVLFLSITSEQETLRLFLDSHYEQNKNINVLSMIFAANKLPFQSGGCSFLLPDSDFGCLGQEIKSKGLIIATIPILGNYTQTWMSMCNGEGAMLQQLDTFLLQWQVGLQVTVHWWLLLPFYNEAWEELGNTSNQLFMIFKW